jgi:hypothetical protein
MPPPPAAICRVPEVRGSLFRLKLSEYEVAALPEWVTRTQSPELSLAMKNVWALVVESAVVHSSPQLVCPPPLNLACWISLDPG